MEPLPYYQLAKKWQENLPDLWNDSGIYDLRYADEEGNFTRPYTDEDIENLNKWELRPLKHRINNIIAAYPELAKESLENQPEWESTILERAYYGGFDPLTRFVEGSQSALSSGLGQMYSKDIYSANEYDNLISNFTDYHKDRKNWIDKGYITDEDEIAKIEDLGNWLEKVPNITERFEEGGKEWVKLNEFIPYSYDTKYTHKEFEGLVGKPIVERKMTDEEAESKTLSPVEEILKESADWLHNASRERAKQWAKEKEGDIRWSAYQEHMSGKPAGFFANFVPNEYWLDTLFGLVPSVGAIIGGAVAGKLTTLAAGPGAGIAAGTAATIGLMTPMEASGEYQEAYDYAYEKYGDADVAKEVARNATATYLSIMAATEWLPTGRYMKMAMPKKAARITAKGLNKSIYTKILHDPNVGNIFKQIGGTPKTRLKFHVANASKQAFIEGMQEFTQYLGQVAVKTGYQDETFSQIYKPHEAASSMLGGMMFGGILGGGASVYGGKDAFKIAQGKLVAAEMTQYGEISPEEIVGIRQKVVDGETVGEVVTESMLEKEAAEAAKGDKPSYKGKPLYRKELGELGEGVSKKKVEASLTNYVSELLNPNRTLKVAIDRDEIEDKKLETLVKKLDKWGAGRQGEKLVATIQQGGKEFVDSLKPEEKSEINKVLKGAVGNINKDVLNIVKNPDNLIEDVLSNKISIDFEIDKSSGKIQTPHRKTSLTIKDKAYVQDLMQDYEQELADEFGDSPSAKKVSNWFGRNLRLDISEDMLKEEIQKDIEKSIAKPDAKETAKALQAEYAKEFFDQTFSKLEGDEVVDEKGNIEKDVKGLTAMVVNEQRYKGKYFGQVGEVVKHDKKNNKVLMKMPDGKSLAFSISNDIALTPESAEEAGVSIKEPPISPDVKPDVKTAKVSKKESQKVEEVLRLRDEVARGTKEIEKAIAQKKTPPSMIPFAKMQKDLSKMLKDPKIIEELKARGEFESVKMFIEEDKTTAPVVKPKDEESPTRKRFHEVGKGYDKNSPIATKKAIVKAMKDIMGPHAPDIESVLVDEIENNPKAMGSYIDGMLQFVLGEATEQTAVHEPVHWFLNRILTEEEYAFLAEEFKGENPTETEENMADAATKFYFDNKTFVGKIKNILKRFWNAIQSFFDSSINDEMSVFDLFSRIGRDFEEKVYKDNFDVLNINSSINEINSELKSNLESQKINDKTYDEIFETPKSEYTPRNRQLFNNIHTDLPTIRGAASLPKLPINQNIYKQAMNTPFGYKFTENILKMGNKISLSQPFSTKGISKYEKYAVDKLYNNIIEDAEFEDKKSIDTQELVKRYERYIEQEFPLNSYMVRFQASNVNKNGMAFPTLYDKFVSKDVTNVYSERIMTTDNNFYLGQQHGFYLEKTEDAPSYEDELSGIPTQKINGYGWFVYVEHDVNKGFLPVKLSIMYEVQRDIDKMLRQSDVEGEAKISGISKEFLSKIESGEFPPSAPAINQIFSQYFDIVNKRLKTTAMFSGEQDIFNRFVEARAPFNLMGTVGDMSPSMGLKNWFKDGKLTDSAIDNIIKENGFYSELDATSIIYESEGQKEEYQNKAIKEILDGLKTNINELREFVKNSTKSAISERLGISAGWGISSLLAQESQKPYHINKLGQKIINHPDFVYWDGKYAPDVVADNILNALSPVLSEHGKKYKAKMKDFTKKVNISNKDDILSGTYNFKNYFGLSGAHTISKFLYGINNSDTIPETALIELPIDKTKRILAVKQVLTNLNFKPKIIKRIISELDKYDNYVNKKKSKDKFIKLKNNLPGDSIPEDLEFKESEWHKIEGNYIKKRNYDSDMDNSVSLSRDFLSKIIQTEFDLRRISFEREIYHNGLYQPSELTEWTIPVINNEIKLIKDGSTDSIKQQQINLKRLFNSSIAYKQKIKGQLDYEIKKNKGMLYAQRIRYDLFKKDNNNLKQAVNRLVNLGNRQLKGLLKDSHNTELLSEYGTVMLERINEIKALNKGVGSPQIEKFLNESKTFRQKQIYTYILKSKDRGISTAGFAGAKAHSRLEAQFDKFESTSRLYVNDFELNDPARVKTYEEYEMKKIGDGGNLALVDKIFGLNMGNHLKTDDMLLNEIQKIMKGSPISLPSEKQLRFQYEGISVVDGDETIVGKYFIKNLKTGIEKEITKKEALSFYRDAPRLGPVWIDTKKVLNSLNIPYEEKKYKELDTPIVIATLPENLEFKIPRFHEKPNNLSDKEPSRKHEYVNDGENVDELLRITGKESKASKRESIRYYISKAANNVLNGLNEISNITQKGAVTPTGNLWDESAYNKSKEHFENAYKNLNDAYKISLEDFVKAMFKSLKKIPAEFRNRVREFLLKWAREKDSEIDTKINTRNASIGIIELLGLSGRKRARLSREIIDSGTMDRIVDSMLNRSVDADNLAIEGTAIEDPSDAEEVSNDLAFWTESYDFKNEQFFKFLEESDSKGFLNREQVSNLMKVVLTGDKNLYMSHLLGEYEFEADTIEKKNMVQSFWVKNQEINRTTGSEKPSWWYANLDESGNRPKGRNQIKKLIPKIGGSSIYGKDIRSNKDLPSTYVMSFSDWALKKNPYMGEEIKISRIYLNDIVDVWKGEKDDSGSKYYGKQAWIDLGKGKDSLVKKWDNDFASGIKDSKGNLVVRTIVEIKAGGSNPSFIVARVPQFVLEFSSDMDAVKGYFDTELEMGNMTKKMVDNFISSINESNAVDGVGNKYAAAQHITMHEVMKRTHGSEYLMRTDDILHHMRRAQMPHAEGVVPVGVGSHTIKILDQSKVSIVSPDGTITPMTEFIAGLAGRSRSDGASLVETEHLDSIAKNIGREAVQGGLPLREVKSVVWFNSREDDFSRNNYTPKVFRNSDIWEGVHYLALKHNDFVIDEGLKFIDADGNVVAYSVRENNHIRIYDANDNRITRLSTLDEAKEPDGGSGAFKLDGRVSTDVLTLPEESLRIVKMPNQRPKNSAAFPFSWLSKLYEPEFKDLRLEFEKRLLNVARANIQAMYDARKNPEVMAGLFGQLKSDNAVFLKETDALIEPIPGQMIGDGFMHPHLIKGHIEPVKNKLIGQNAYGGRRRGFGNYPVIKSDIDGSKVSSYDGMAISEDDATMVNFIKQKLNLDRTLKGEELQTAFKESIRNRRPIYLLVGRHPAYNITGVAQVKVTNIVPSGHGNVSWFHPDFVSGPLQADQDGDNNFLHVMYFGQGFSDETIPRLMEQVKNDFKERESFARVEIFKKKSRDLKVNSKADMYKASEMLGTGINAQGIATNAMTFFEDMHYKGLKTTIGGQNIVVRNPYKDKIVMDYAPLNDDISQEYLDDLNLGELVNKNGDKWDGGDKYLMTTPSKEIGLILQGAVDHIKELLLHDWKYSGYDFLIPKMFVQDTGAPIGLKQSRTIARLLRKELTYGGLRHGRDPDSRRSKSIDAMFDDSKNMYELNQKLGKARGADIARKANNRRIKNGDNSKMAKQTLPIQKLEFNNNLTTLEKLIAIPHEMTVKYQKENPNDIVHGNPWGYPPNMIVNGITATQKELIRIQKSEQRWYPESKEWQPKKNEAIAFINQLATEFYGIARRKELFDEAMSDSLTSASYPHADEIIELVEKWYNKGDKKRGIKAFKDLDEQQQAYTTLKFLRGTEPQMKQIRKGVQVRAKRIIQSMVKVSEQISQSKSDKQKEFLREKYNKLRDDLDKLTTVTTINKQPRLRNIESILPRQLMHPGVWSEYINRFGPNLREASNKAVKLRMRKELGINELITKDCP